MNIFYAPPEQVYRGHIELRDQEAKHASRVLRFRQGDDIVIVDGKGNWYDCTVSRITDSDLSARIKSTKEIPKSHPRLVLGLGLIKKRDRLEFAVEKAVELGVSEIVLFRSRHTVKENVRMDRLEMTVLSAMKQSLRAWLPDVRLLNSLEEVLVQYTDYEYVMAHEEADIEAEAFAELKQKDKLLMLVGPEGGFSQKEVDLVTNKGAKIVSLGRNRLRAETAAVTLLSQFIWKK